MRSNLIEDYKRKLKLTKRQKEIIVGKLLGDGHLETQNNGRTYRLKIEHSIKQRNYVDWLYQEFREWVLTPPLVKKCKLGDKIFHKYWFNTISHGSLRFYAQQFYRGGKKIVPKLIHRWLTPLALAVWFMDDGSIKSKLHKARIINTQGFTKQEVLRLIESLAKVFGLKSFPRRQKEGYQIMILSESMEKFVKIVKKFIHPSMNYKIIGLG